jgi:hypothetical protein
MPYSNVKTPAFYLSVGDYLDSIGMIKYDDTDLSTLHLLNPSHTKKIPIPETENWYETEQINYDVNFNSFINSEHILDEDGYIYIFVLGHNLHSAGCAMTVRFLDYNNQYVYSSQEPAVEILNHNGPYAIPEFNNCSIFRLKFLHGQVYKGYRIEIRGHNQNAIDTPIRIGSINLCSKYTPPFSPDLNLTMSKEFDGVSTTTSKGGVSLSNAQYTRGGQYWTTGYSWELNKQNYSTNSPTELSIANRARTMGRKNWNLQFSYLAPKDVMPETELLDAYFTDDYDNDTPQDNLGATFQGSHSLFARLLGRTQGSHLPFIFQPDATNNNADGFSICRFNQNKFDFTMSGPELYSVNLNIRESW